MARTAMEYDTRTKTARAKLPVRVDAYYRQVGPGKTLGYVSRAGRNGSWLVREKVAGKYTKRTLAQADDMTPADGRDVMTYEQALRAVTKSDAVVALGRMTVADALAVYFANHESAHAKAYKAVADRHIVPTLGDVRVNTLSKTHVETWRAGLLAEDSDDKPNARRASMDTANRIVTHLKAALTKAFDDPRNGIVTDAAWRRVKSYKGVGRARTEQLTAEQVELLMRKAAAIDASLSALIGAAYLTGARPGELAGCDVGDLNAERGTLNIRNGKTGPRVVTLTEQGAGYLERIAGTRKRNAPLLPRVDGTRWPNKRTDANCGWYRPMRDTVAAAELPSTVSLYTLRHAHISHALESGQSQKLIAENCGTSLRMIEKHYGHITAGTRRAQIESTGARLRLPQLAALGRKSRAGAGASK